MSRRYTFARMQAPEFREACTTLALPSDVFCFLTGTNPRKFTAWSKGAEDIPPWVPVFLVLLTLPTARTMAYRTAQTFYQFDQPEPAPELRDDH